MSWTGFVIASSGVVLETLSSNAGEFAETRAKEFRGMFPGAKVEARLVTASERPRLGAKVKFARRNTAEREVKKLTRKILRGMA